MPPSRRVILLLLTLVTSAAIRLANVASNPGWFSDEGTHLSLAANLLRGRAQYLALEDAALLVARLPLFDVLLSGGLVLAGAGPGGDLARGMAVLRGFTALLGVLTTLLLYLTAHRLGGPRGPWLGLLAALAHAVFPQAIVYSRLGFSYNLVAPLLLVALWSLGEFQRAAAGRRAWAARWLALASLAVGLAALTDVWAWTLVAPLVLVAALGARRAGRGALAALSLAALPWALYAGVMLARAPATFLFDLGYNFSRLAGRTLPAQAALLGGNLLTLFGQEGWVALGAAGLFMLRPAGLRRLALLFFWLPLVLVGRSAPLFSLSFYYLIPLLPLAALGLGALVLAGASALARLSARALRRWLGRRAGLAGHGLAAAAVVAVALYLAAAAAAGARDGFTTVIDPFLLAPTDTRSAAAFVNARTAPGDLVIASPALAWLLTANAADFQMTVAHSGLATPHLPASLPAGRFAFDPSLRQARYVVVDNLWQEWGVFHVPGLPDLLATVEAWPLVHEAGAIRVYARPE